MTLHIGAAGNRQVSAITVGTAGGNRPVLAGWIGTASGARQFFTSITAHIQPAFWEHTSEDPSIWVINMFIQIDTGSTVNAPWFRYEFGEGVFGEWQDFPGGSLEAHDPDQPFAFDVRGQIRDGPNESDPIVFVTAYTHIPAP